MMSDLTVQEAKNKVRINNQKRAAGLLSDFFEMGFRTYTSFKSVLDFYNNSAGVDAQVFWQLRHNITPEMCDVVEQALEKLKDE